MADIERRALTLLRDVDHVRYAWDSGLRPEWFQDPMCRTVCEFVLDYWRTDGTAPTPYVLSEQFPGWTSEEILDPESISISWMVDTLRRRRSTYELQVMLRDAAQASSDPIVAVRELHRRAYAAAESVEPRRARVNTADTIEERRARYGHRQEHPEGLGLPHGLNELDAHTGGILPGELAVIGGFAKTGKSFWLANTAVSAMRAGHKPLLITLEMSLEEMEERADALFSGVGYAELNRGQLSLDDYQKFCRGQDEMRDLGGIAIERPPDGERTVVGLCARARDAGCDYLIIDQLSFMEPSRKVDSLKEHHGSIIRELKNEISRSGHELACLLAVQLNRGSTETGIKLSSFSNATEIEQTVDIALGLWRSNEMRRNSAMQLSVLGSRRSDIKSWMLYWRLAGRTQIETLEEIED